MTNSDLKTQTPSQTVGPYFAYGLTPEQYGYNFKSLISNDLTVRLNKDEKTFDLSGVVYDGNGTPIDDALVELWIDDGEHSLFGRHGTGTEEGNAFIFKIIKPNSVRGQAPFINLILFMRGQLLHSYTRIYFADEQMLNETDLVLNSVDKDRRHTLLAHKEGDKYVFNIYMQGPNETVFFEY